LSPFLYKKGFLLKKLIIIFLALFAFYKYIFYIPELGNSSLNSSIPYKEINSQNSYEQKTKQNTPITYANNSPENAFKNNFSRVQVTGKGSVYHILKDDNEGKRHQKFILRLPSGQTLLVAHNIDLAPRLNGLQKGDTIKFYGQYEWNPKGGVLHWTHHDPKGRHKNGWLKYNGRTYQ
jgi:hypothetical protein